jgi:hypothetical protein
MGHCLSSGALWTSGLDLSTWSVCATCHVCPCLGVYRRHDWLPLFATFGCSSPRLSLVHTWSWTKVLTCAKFIHWVRSKHLCAPFPVWPCVARHFERRIDKLSLEARIPLLFHDSTIYRLLLESIIGPQSLLMFLLVTYKFCKGVWCNCNSYLINLTTVSGHYFLTPRIILSLESYYLSIVFSLVLITTCNLKINETWCPFIFIYTEAL